MLKPILIGVASGLLILLLYFVAVRVAQRRNFNKYGFTQDMINYYFYKLEDEISVKHYPINIDSLREFVLNDSIDVKKKSDSIGKLYRVIVNCRGKDK